MPVERVRRSNAQGRQKACSECVKAKRKCDLQQPNCLRCTRQRLSCTYPPQPISPSRPIPDPFDSEETCLIDPLFDNQTFDLPLDMYNSDAVFTQHVEVLNPVPDFAGPMSDLRQPDVDGNIDVGETPSVPFSIETYPSAKSFSNLIASELFESRVGYSMDQWRLAPRTMVERNCTPWSHSKLYSELMPRSMQDAFAACALYTNRTETNARFVLRHITDRAHELIEQPIPSLPAELMARAHAVLLYQIMLICSNDFRYFGQTQALLCHMKDLSKSLHDLVLRKEQHDDDSTEELPLYPSTATRAAWLSYIFRESCRRTFIATCHAISICALLQGNMITCNHAMSIGNRVTLSAGLWEAESPLEFGIVWNEKNHYLVKEMDFSEVLRSANADDVDVFGRMLMVGIMGKDDVSGWLHSKGGKL